MNGIFQYLIANPILVVAITGAIVVMVLGIQKQQSGQSLASLIPAGLLPGTPAILTQGVVSRVPEVVATLESPPTPEKGFKVALLVAECLRQNGYPESEVEDFVRTIAAKLLVKKV